MHQVAVIHALVMHFLGDLADQVQAQSADGTVEDIRIQVRCGRGQRVEGRALVAELQ